MILSSDLNVFLKSTIPKVYNKYYHGFWSMTFLKKSISWDKNLLVLYFVYLAHQPFLLLNNEMEEWKHNNPIITAQV